MKNCSLCKQDKELSDFNKNSRRSDGLQTHCRSCTTVQSRLYYNDNKEVQKKQIYAAKLIRVNAHRERLLEYLKQNPCVDCGEDDIVVLEFDHLADKEFHVWKILKEGYSWEKVWKEVQKCDVRCANCHRRKTARDFGWHKLIDP